MHPPDGVEQKAFLVVQLTVNCEVCGEHEYIIAGHHLRPIVSLLQEFIEAEPELTAEGEVEVIGQTVRDVPFRPEDN